MIKKKKLLRSEELEETVVEALYALTQLIERAEFKKIPGILNHPTYVDNEERIVRSLNDPQFVCPRKVNYQKVYGEIIQKARELDALYPRTERGNNTTMMSYRHVGDNSKKGSCKPVSKNLTRTRNSFGGNGL